MTPDQIRESYLRYYEERGHTRHPSDSLVPENDPTLLFTGAGMNQFKAEFMGKGNLPFTRATTSQKCLRMPDLENVGRTPSHHTFFEMLGNFSFGDYFKEEAIAWAWDLLTNVWGVPAERLSISVYEEDDEAAAIWADKIGVPGDRIYRYGEDDNFWPASAPSQGPNGICGPCSEIYYDWTPEAGEHPRGGPAVDGRRFTEIWNLVFTQFERRDGGELVPLPQRNIDTGMGFERIVRVLESLESGTIPASNFDTATFAPIMAAIHGHVGRGTTFGTPEGERTRRIADHVRAAVFCIADGVRPSNAKQGYVVRKVLRRAMIDRHLLGGDLRQTWLATLADTIIDTMRRAWPDLGEARTAITSAIATEEQKFASTFLGASQKLHALAEKARASGEQQLSAGEAFLLYDTFGLPLDLQRMLLDEHDLGVDEEGYRAAMAEQRRRSQEASRISDSIFDEGPLKDVGALPETAFVRDERQIEASILAVVDDTETDGQVLLVLDRTPFYAEGGGQVGDCGLIEGPDFAIEIDDAVALRGVTLHRGVVVRGHPVTGTATVRVDRQARAATERNHTGTHLLHHALRAVLGDEATQAGSLVTPARLRFDFRFPRGLTDDELAAIEDRVNTWILANRPVSAEEMGREAARMSGAMALFGEKYGDQVRVVKVLGAQQGEASADSVELCGGTHVAYSGDIGLLKIVSEGSIAAGVRRIEARTGLGVLEHVRGEESTLRRSAALFKTSPDRLEERIEATQAELKEARRALEEARGELAAGKLDSGLRTWNDLRILLAVVPGVPVKTLRDIAADYVGSRADLVILGVPEADSSAFLVAASPKATEAGLAADGLVREIASALGGKGGGKPAFAQGKGRPAEDLQATLEDVLERAGATSDGA